MTGPLIRPARPQDVALIMRFIRAAAAYEQLSHEARGSEEDLRRALFGTPPRAGCLIAEVEGEAAGMALYRWTFSTFLGKPGRWLEDLWVEPRFRRRGIARALCARLAQETLQEGGARLAWAVLDWNAPAIVAYDAMGAESLREWTIRRLSGEALAALAKEAA
ncbi:MAG: GNAT family N-acetyltransferase [Rhodovarius sp.]|nr:GNAT family N-acetyltransferase [Rhodovarius sp.]